LYYIFQIPPESECVYTLYKCNPYSILDSQTLTIKDAAAQNYSSMVCFTPDYSEVLNETLEEQLKNCRELLDLEPESKWPLLTSVLLMKSLDLVQYADSIKATLDLLKQVDSFRARYYSDLQSRIQFEVALTQNSSHLSDKFSLTNGRLTCLHHCQYLAFTLTVDLSNNLLNDKHLAQLYVLINCRKLVLDSNRITSLTFLPSLPKLEVISLLKNPLKSTDTPKDVLTCPKLISVIT